MVKYSIIVSFLIKVMCSANLLCQSSAFEVPNSSYAYSPSQVQIPLSSIHIHSYDSILLPSSAKNLINQEIDSVLANSSGYFLYSNSQIYRATYYIRLNDSIIAFITELNHGPTHVFWHLYLYNEFTSGTSDGTVIIEQSRIIGNKNSVSHMARLIGIQGPLVKVGDLNNDGFPELMIKWIAYLQTGFISICQDYYSFDFTRLKANHIVQVETKAISSVFGSDSCFVREISSVRGNQVTVNTYTCTLDSKIQVLIGSVLWQCSDEFRLCHVDSVHWVSEFWSENYPESVLVGFNYTISKGRNLFD